MTSEPRPERRQPISPELVLVSPPEAARRAREELPPPASFETARPAPATAPRPTPPPPPPYRWVETEPLVVKPERPRRRRAGRLVLAGWILAVGALAAWYVVDHQAPEQRVLGPRGRAAPSPAPGTVTGTGTTTHPAVTTRATGTIATQAPRTQTQPEPPAAKPPQKPKRGSTPTKATVGFVPARTWTWSSSKAARGYVFSMTRNGREVLRVQTSKPRFVLPRSFRFHAGTYRWRVRRVPAPRNGRLLVDSKFVVTAAAAALANR